MDPAQYRDKIQKIRSRFRNSRDIHTYLTDIRKYPDRSGPARGRHCVPLHCNRLPVPLLPASSLPR